MCSVLLQTLAFFEERGVPVIKIQDQGLTDLEKAFTFASSKFNMSSADTLLVVGEEPQSLPSLLLLPWLRSHVALLWLYFGMRRFES